ncbi:MAG: hypothetical protein ACRDDY_16810 [Clostridium sp.]|uniref:hypothetical protein n=1 Tax=Clostridium sp. TaxID=1506 RepID=UPI003EE7CBA2
MTSRGLKIGKQYLVDGDLLYCVAVGDDAYSGYNCSECGRELKKGICFMDRLDDQFTTNMIFGSECIKKLDIQVV